ncbi:DExH-box splicing factor binding site-domain-containing protein [Leucosporidium creatinivorum]|uniref:DExH-box splicing factor binding site-domain-containing protein n=1 Tax=Leucosporidium creatinivorum TaxID=106004 RepID=A0A1Y2D7K5_9BASI|nr:DExH-box splicing factor binding site-domain-containing protein [Leucosporidium creatinivorum]
MSGISFKIAAPPRPSSSASTPRGSAPPSRPSSRNHRSQQPEDDDSDSDDDGLAARGKKKRDELVTGFDKEGVTKKHKEAKAAPLVIPSLPNKDWRKAAEEAGARRNGGRKKREMYIPDAVGGMRVGGPVGDGSQGNMGTRDTINSEPIVGGLALGSKKEEVVTAAEDGVVAMEVEEEVTTVVEENKAPETEEQRALRELMSGGASTTDQTPSVDIIHSAADARGALGDAVDSSASTFQRDVHSRPDEATLDDYSRVPVGEFGAAMLRGMGWKPGQAASRNGRKGPTEAFVPKARPAMLGIGAKPMADVLGPEDKGKGPHKSRREELKFMPLLKREREGSASGSGRDTPAIANSPHTSARPQSGMSSRLPSVSPPPSRPSSTRPVAADSFSTSRDDRDRRDREGSSYRRSWDDDDRRRDDRDRGGSSRRDEERYSSSARRRDERNDGYRSSSKRERSPGRESGKESYRRRSRSPAGRGDRDREGGSSSRRRSRSPRRDERRRDDDRDRRR